MGEGKGRDVELPSLDNFLTKKEEKGEKRKPKTSVSIAELNGL